MLEEMEKKFEDNFTDEEKIQIFNLIFSGYYSLAYVRFLAQKKAGKDLGIEVKEPQNLLPPEGEGADYDDYLDAILAQPNKNEVVEHPNKPELQTNIEVPEIEVKEDEAVVPPISVEPVVSVEPMNVEIEVPKPEVEPVTSSTIDASPISSSPLGGDLAGFPSSAGPNSSLGGAVSPISVEEEKEDEVVDEDETPLAPTVETAPEENKVIEFGVGNIGGSHEPTIEVIQEDSRPKKETATVEIRFETPEQVENGGGSTVVIPQAEESKTADVPQPSQEVPTVSLEQLQNPHA